MLIRIRETGQLMDIGAFKAMHPNTSFPQPISVECLDGFGADVVLESPTPENQEAVLDGAVFKDGAWYTNYKVQG
jgi:hypothetical protein